jgi:multidrug resistance efflux pump
LSQTSVRTQSDQALLRSQLESVTQKRDTEANALQQLEVRAPHDGFLMLEKNWSGMTPMVGATARPGDVIGNLPDLSHLVANFQIPEQRTFALQTGQTIEVRLMGSGKHVPLKVTRIGTTASPIGEKSPVKFIEVDAAFSAEHIQQMQLTPGQSLSGNLIFANKEKS